MTFLLLCDALCTMLFSQRKLYGKPVIPDLHRISLLCDTGAKIQNCRIIEYPELEGTYKDHQSPTPDSAQDAPGVTPGA